MVVKSNLGDDLTNEKNRNPELILPDHTNTSNSDMPSTSAERITAAAANRTVGTRTITSITGQTVTKLSKSPYKLRGPYIEHMT